MPDETSGLGEASLAVLQEAEEGQLLDAELSSGAEVTGFVNDVDVEQDGLTGCAKRATTLDLLDGRQVTAHTLYSSQEGDERLEHATLRSASSDEGDVETIGIEAVQVSEQGRLAAGDGGRDG